MALAYERHRAKDPVRRLLMDARKRAKKRGIKFEISPEDINIPSHCPIMGWELTNIQGQGNRVKTNISIDRIDSSLGYEKGNIQIWCGLANVMKNAATKQELLMFAHGILKYYGESN